MKVFAFETFWLLVKVDENILFLFLYLILIGGRVKKMFSRIPIWQHGGLFLILTNDSKWVIINERFKIVSEGLKKSRNKQ